MVIPLAQSSLGCPVLLSCCGLRGLRGEIETRSASAIMFRYFFQATRDAGFPSRAATSQPGCPHWQAISVKSAASLQDWLQYSLSSRVEQPQAGCVHFSVLMKSSKVY